MREEPSPRAHVTAAALERDWKGVPCIPSERSLRLRAFASQGDTLDRVKGVVSAASSSGRRRTELEGVGGCDADDDDDDDDDDRGGRTHVVSWTM